MLARQKAVIARKRRQALAQERGYSSQGRQVEGAANRQRGTSAYRNWQAAHEAVIRPYGNAGHSEPRSIPSGTSRHGRSSRNAAPRKRRSSYA